jgi:nitrous oxidase accessory protein
MRAFVHSLGVVLIALVVACAPRRPQPVAYGTENCDYCRMTISEPRFGAQVVTSTGKARKFDSIECLVSYYLQSRSTGVVKSVWVTDYRKPGTFIAAEDAIFLRGGRAHSPMGLGLMAFASSENAEVLTKEFGGTPLRWKDVVTLVETQEKTLASHNESQNHASRDAQTQAEGAITVSPGGDVRSLTDAVARAKPGARIVVRRGVYREPMIVVDKPLEIVGDSGAVLDGGNDHQIMAVKADDVTVRGLTFRNVGVSYTEDRAAIKVVASHNCAITDNRIEHGFFGIYLSAVEGCRIERNVLTADKRDESGAGNGIHLWSSRRITIADNHVSGHRDGIYFEFVHDADVRGNTSEGNLRYGLHFMYSDSCRYVHNIFRANIAGVAVMFTKHVDMFGNTFEKNWGSASYGLLLKEIYDAHLDSNRFSHNTVGLFADGANRIRAEHNEFTDNGWAVKLMASTQDGTFERNVFAGNTFDVATNSRQSFTTFDGNYWDDYSGYDLNHDGVGDVPHRPVRLFSLVVEQNAPALILMRGLFVGLIDAAERVIPALTPETLADAHPAMHRFR